MTDNISPEEAAALQKQNCIFCKIIKGEIPSKKLHEDSKCIAVLDINPANEGHVILLPKEHYAIMPQVPVDVLAHMAMLTKKISKALLLSTLGKSTSIFVANGAVAGQKAPHFMIHIIPRKVENEFFVIPIKEAEQSHLEQVKEIIIPKLESLTGKKMHKKRDLPKESIMHAPPRIHETAIAEEKKQEPVTLNHPRKIARVGIKKEKGFLYYIDEDGDVARAPMSRGKKKKAKSEKVKVLKEEETNAPTLDDTSSDNESDDNPQSSSLDDISRMLLGGR